MLPTKYAKYNLLPTTYNYIYKYFLLPTQVPKYYTLLPSAAWLLAAMLSVILSLLWLLAMLWTDVEWSGVGWIPRHSEKRSVPLDSFG